MKEKPARRRRGWCSEGCGKRGNAEDKLGRWYCWKHAAEHGLLSVQKPPSLTPFTSGGKPGRVASGGVEARRKGRTD